jgi:hypothetical protein
VTVAGSKQRCCEDSGIGAEEVVLGVDPHLDVHVAVALDGLDRRLGELAVPTTEKGYESLVTWGKELATWVALAWRARAATAPGWPAT